MSSSHLRSAKVGSEDSIDNSPEKIWTNLESKSNSLMENTFPSLGKETLKTKAKYCTLQNILRQNVIYRYLRSAKAGSDDSMH